MTVFEILIAVFLTPAVFGLGVLFMFVFMPVFGPAVMWCERQHNRLQSYIDKRNGDVD